MICKLPDGQYCFIYLDRSHPSYLPSIVLRKNKITIDNLEMFPGVLIDIYDRWQKEFGAAVEEPTVVLQERMEIPENMSRPYQSFRDLFDEHFKKN